MSIKKIKRGSDTCGCGSCDSHKEEAKTVDSGCGCGCGHTYESGEAWLRKRIFKLSLGFVLFLVALLLMEDRPERLVFYLAAFLFVGGEVVLAALINITKGKVFDENFLMCIATIGAFAIGEFSEGVAVMLFYQVGELFQELAVRRSRKSIADLMDIRPDFANLKKGEQILSVAPEKVAVGDLIIIRPGERVPLDGIVVEGISLLDTASITGESLPREIEKGAEIFSGSINQTGVLTVEVKKIYQESTVARILDLVENAEGKKAPTESFVTKFARYYTPAVVISAVLLAVIPPLVLPGASFSEWIYRALIFLVASCPCALLISIPLGFFGGIGGAAKHGILLKGGNYLEALNRIDTIIFDKTGTLTKGSFKVAEIELADTADTDEPDGAKEKQILRYAAIAEQFSTHPIAVSIKKAYGEEMDPALIESYEELAGFGTKAKAEGHEILLGNAKLMEKEGILISRGKDEVGTSIYIAVDRKYQGALLISDEIKEDAKEAVKRLRKAGVARIVMLTGDKKVVGERIAAELGLDEVFSELLPEQKVEKLEELKRNKTTKGAVVFVGDGINDAPVLLRADVGVAMGGLGSDAAIEAADVVLMTDEPKKLADAIEIAHRTKRIIWQNIIFALAVKLAVLILGAGGLATMWEAVFADVGVALIAVGNAMRALHVKCK